MEKKIWNAYEIWNATQWFTDFEKEYKKFLGRINI